jgi:hypothetical protein
MNLNSVWATEKAAPVARSGFGIIPANLFLRHHGAENSAILRTDPFTGCLHTTFSGQMESDEPVAL